MSNPTNRTADWINAVNSFPQNVRPDIDRMWDTQGYLPADVVGEFSEARRRRLAR